MGGVSQDGQSTLPRLCAAASTLERECVPGGGAVSQDGLVFKDKKKKARPGKKGK